jgi:hypothetical protein
MPIDNETKQRIAANVSEREELTEDNGRFRGVIRVSLDATEGVKSVAHSGNHDMIIDEPIERGGFETITQEIHTEGSITPEQVEHLCDRAQNVCFTHNTLKHGVKMTTVIYLYGEDILRKTSNLGD